MIISTKTLKGSLVNHVVKSWGKSACWAFIFKSNTLILTCPIPERSYIGVIYARKNLPEKHNHDEIFSLKKIVKRNNIHENIIFEKRNNIFKNKLCRKVIGIKYQCIGLLWIYLQSICQLFPNIELIAEHWPLYSSIYSIGPKDIFKVAKCCDKK